MNTSTILETILTHKQYEIQQNSQQTSMALQDKRARENAASRRGFIRALREKMDRQQAEVIAEIKKASPSKGLYLQQARAACELPVIRKDFIIDPYQVAEAGAIGADCILLIVAALNPPRLRDLAECAAEYQLDVLVEVHNETELDIALAIGFELIGINNRNLHDFHTDLETTFRLATLVPDDKLIVTESGISTSADVKRMMSQGIYGFLIGETFMRAEDPGAKLHEIFG